MSFERRKVRVGRVVDDKMDKTVVVDVEWRRTHQLYRKSVRRKSRFLAHDAENQCRIGDQVRIIETRPLSKTKRWRIADILAREEIADIQPEEITVDEVVLRAPVEEPETPVKPAQEPDQEETVAVATAEEADRSDHVEEEPSPEPETAVEETSVVEEEPVAVAEPEEPGEEPEVTREDVETGTAEEEPVAEVKEEPVAVAEPEGQEEESDAEEKEVGTEAVEGGPKEEPEVEQQASTSEETAKDEESTDR